MSSNQLPRSIPEFTHTKDRKGAKYLNFGTDGICDPCKVHSQRDKIDWRSRENELITLLDKYRSKNNQYDCLVPGSGGKDSAMQAHLLKYKYGMISLYNLATNSLYRLWETKYSKFYKRWWF